MKVNKYGLSRDIPDPIRKQIRTACGYGCVVCGNAIYQYEHITPPFSEAQTHDPERISLLCGQCHDQVTRGIWSKEKIAQARQNPICKQQGFSRVGLDVTSREKFVIKVGHTEFLNLGPVIRLDGEEILSINPPEEPNTWPIISAKFFDRNSNEIAEIVKNEWRGSTGAFDIETRAGTISIRSGDRKIDLVLILKPPNMLIIKKMNMQYGATTISGTSDQGFVVTTKTAQLIVPSDPIRIERAPFWVSCNAGQISLGSDAAITYFAPDGNKHPIASSYDIDNAKVEFVDPIEEGIPPSPGVSKPGHKVQKITSTSYSGSISIKIPIASIPNIGPRPPRQIHSKTGRNQPCPCGSGKKYKKCCGK